MPTQQLEALALSVLQQRGMPPTAANLQAVKNALEANPELLNNVQGSFRQQQRPGEADRTESVNPIVFRDAFDQALENAIGVEPATSGAGGAQAAPPVDINAGNQPAPPITPVTTEGIQQIVSALPPETQNAVRDAIEGGSVGQGAQPVGGATPSAQVDDDGGIPIPLVVPGPRRPTTGTDVVPVRSGPPTAGSRGIAQAAPGQLSGGPNPLQIEGPQARVAGPAAQGALPAPQGALPPPQRALPAPDTPKPPVEAVRIAHPESRVISSEDVLNMHAEAIARGDIPAGQHTPDWRKAAASLEDAGLLALEPDNPVRPKRTRAPSDPFETEARALFRELTEEATPQVERDIGRTIDAQDGPLKQTTFAGREAVEFDMDGQRFVAAEIDGEVQIANKTEGGELFSERRPDVLQRIKAFLVKHGSTLARLL